MPRLLFTVEDRFLIRGRGLIVVPGLTLADADPARVGDPLLLRKPDGVELHCTLGGIDLMLVHRVVPPELRRYPILLTGLDKEAVPEGTEVWSVDPSARL